MKTIDTLHTNNLMEIESPDGSACHFACTIQSIDGGGYSFYIKHNGNTSPTKSFSYTLADREHQSYLDLFEKLSDQFGLRIPHNRQQKKTPTSQAIGYSEVLTQNIHPNILYGYGDPAVLRVEEDGFPVFYCVATSNDAANSFPILRSADLINWELKSFVFPQGLKPEWASDGEFISDYWAPEMHLYNQEFCTYFVARDKETDELCIGLAKSDKPIGPFSTTKDAILKGNVIDPHIFVLNEATAYLYWKEDNNDIWPALLIELLHKHPKLIEELFRSKEDRMTAAFVQTLWPWLQSLPPMERFQGMQILIEVVIEKFALFLKRLQSVAQTNSSGIKSKIANILKYMKTPMYAQQLSKDGTTLVGKKVKVIENDLAWEAHLVEGIWISKQNNKYFLFYAANDFSTDSYGIGAAVSDSPLGPFTKMKRPFLQSNASWWAPGHPSVVNAPDGTPTMFLHAYRPGEAGYKKFRALLSVPLKFEGDVVMPTDKLNK